MTYEDVIPYESFFGDRVDCSTEGLRKACMHNLKPQLRILDTC